MGLKVVPRLRESGCCLAKQPHFLACRSIWNLPCVTSMSDLMFVPRDGFALDERDSVVALGDDAVLGDGGQHLALPRPLQRAPLVRDDLGASVVGHHCKKKQL